VIVGVFAFRGCWHAVCICPYRHSDDRLNDREEPHRLPRESVDALFDVHLFGVSRFADDTPTAQTAPLGVFLLVRSSIETDGDTPKLERASVIGWGVALEGKKPMEEASGLDSGNGRDHNGLADGKKP
jgi:hypothetical protein